MIASEAAALIAVILDLGFGSIFCKQLPKRFVPNVVCDLRRCQFGWRSAELKPGFSADIVPRTSNNGGFRPRQIHQQRALFLKGHEFPAWLEMDSRDLLRWVCFNLQDPLP